MKSPGILARLEKEHLAPSREADKFALIRRVTYDLTGLPPSAEEIWAFVDDGSPDAYERLVDRLLASRRYGEHRARYWLDGARYGDTHGQQYDNMRLSWPFRDHVIKAFNENKPFDEFVVEQIAGDLLPAENYDQLVATGFNRAHVTTNEDGAIPEELQYHIVTDRVQTVASAFLGTTASCAIIHNDAPGADPAEYKTEGQAIVWGEHVHFWPMARFGGSTRFRADDLGDFDSSDVVCELLESSPEAWNSDQFHVAEDFYFQHVDNTAIALAKEEGAGGKAGRAHGRRGQGACHHGTRQRAEGSHLRTRRLYAARRTGHCGRSGLFASAAGGCAARSPGRIWKTASTRSPYSYARRGEYEIFEFDLGSTFNHAEMAALIAPRPFMVERGHFDGVAPDEKVAHEFAEVRHLYEARLGLRDRCEIEWFAGPHTINGKGTLAFLHRHLKWPGAK